MIRALTALRHLFDWRREWEAFEEEWRRAEEDQRLIHKRIECTRERIRGGARQLKRSLSP